MSTDRQLIREFKAIGKEELGYEGPQLAEYAERSLREYREREREREERKLAEEEKAREREREERQMAADEKARERDYLLAMEKLRLDAEGKRTEGLNGRPAPVSNRPTQITMPMFNDKEEIVDNFLTQFEKLATAHQVPAEQWAINISAFLQGAAKDVYHNMPPSEVDDYDALKRALLRHYELSAESFRKLFRESTKKATETHAQFHSRVRVLFDKWMKMAGTALTYEGIREEMLKEHVLSSYRKDLVVFLAERDFSTLDDISSMAERYESAHARPTTWGSKDRPSNGERKGFTEVAAQQRNEQNGGRPGVDSPSHRHSRGSGNTPGVEKDTQVRRSGPVCYNCNKPGHLGKDCRKPRPYTVSVAVRSNPEGREAQANLLDCRVNGAVAKMLFDSGCNYPVLVNSRFVKPGDYTGKTIVVSTVTGKRSVFRVAYVDLDTPLVKGRVEAGCHGDLVYDVILGTKYAKLRPYPERCNVKPAQDGLESMTSAKQRSGSCRPVTKPLSDSLPEELGRLQKEDASLNRLRGYAKVGSVRKLPDGKVSFVLDRGVLYRIAKKGSNTKKQLVIPVCKREEVLERAHVGPWGNHLCVTKTKSRVGEEFYWPGVYKDARKYCRKCDKCKRRALGTSHRPETCRTSPLRDENRITLAWDLLCRSESPTASSKYSAQPKKEEDSRVVSTQAESRRQDVAKKKSTVESRNVSNKVEGRTSPKSKKKDSTCKKKSKRCSSENDKLQGDEVNEVIPGWLWGRE